jgi:hypothetical protein
MAGLSGEPVTGQHNVAGISQVLLIVVRTYR